MCGIFGYIHQQGIPEIDLGHINPTSLLHHRGPDDTGWLWDDGEKLVERAEFTSGLSPKIFLLHKRLSIIDLSKQASQPMACQQQRYYLVYNGEIYNFLDLKKYLQNQGIIFHSKSDSEVLLQAYIYWGKECLQKLQGMFAFAIFDRLKKTIFMARDSFGIKPFYFIHFKDRFLFSSEIKALTPFLRTRTVNGTLLFHYLRSGMTDYCNKTLFEEINHLSPGHFLELDCQSMNLSEFQAYWSPSFNQNKAISFTQAAKELKELFLESIRMHLRSDVPVAAALSGGIDSSAIVSAIRHLNPSIDIHTFSYIAKEEQINEEKWVDLVNQDISGISHKVYTNPNFLSADLERLISIQDEPFGSTSIYAQSQVFHHAAQANIKVMLDGQGADEILGGYNFYTAARFASLVKQNKILAAYELFKNNTHLLLRSFAYLLPSTLQIWLRKINNPYIPSWLNKKWFSQQDVLCQPIKASYGRNVLFEELIHTLTAASLPMLLRYADRNSMAFSIESRVPFLTTTMVDFIFSLPEHYIISNQGVRKSVFREAMRNIVAQPILDRRDKIGFATPEKHWLTQLKPWMEQVLLSDMARSLPVFNYKNLIKDWQNMLQNKTSFDFRFWRWVNLIKWFELHRANL